eukprot:m.245027 g.245027  ORF g.245027 m.245027 type:complete len:55 (+) comp15849_c0_seq4:1750-1914(+)
MINLKITSPIDDNFSDDELTFLPFFTYLYARSQQVHLVGGISLNCLTVDNRCPA